MTSLAVRRVCAEGVGSAFLAAAVVGSGIAAERLSPDDVGLQLLENSLVTGAVLIALILALGPVSASFNPIVTLVERVFGLISTRTALAHTAAQVAGCCVGVVTANAMYDVPVVAISRNVRDGYGMWLGELVATLGLVIVVFGVLRSDQRNAIAFAVGGYITAAYWFTSSTSFANPAITAARTLSDTFAGIAPRSALAFVVFQFIGGALAIVAVRLLYPVAAIDPEAVDPEER